LVLDPRPTIRAILEDLDDGVSVGWIARRFHHTFVMMLSEAACTVAEETGLDTVLLSGGTFQNRLVLEGVVADLQKRGLRPVWHRGLSPNDSSICVGQVAVAAAMVGEAATADTYAGRGREDRGCA
jgi:hydrogenase maturation protein HypF